MLVICCCLSHYTRLPAIGRVKVGNGTHVPASARSHAWAALCQRNNGGLMIVRIWRTGVDRSRLEEYAHFEEERSLPMFREQPGLIGVLFLREGEDRAAALTFWE